MKYFITGGAGFIGSNYVNMLLDGQLSVDVEKVTVYDSLTYAGNPKNLQSVSNDSRYNFVLGDITDQSTLESSLPGHDVVINFAAESHVDRSILDPSIFIETNVKGVQRLLEVARKTTVKRFVHISTDEVYGSIANGSWTESSPLEPNSPYAASKAAAELLIRAYAKTYDFDVISTRCSNNYGPRQFPEKLIPFFISKLVRNEKVTLYGNGMNRRDWLHVEDHCRGIQLALERGSAGETYNIGGGHELSNLQLTEYLLGIFEKSLTEISYIEDRPGHDFRYSVDDTKLRNLGYKPIIEFNQGIQSTVGWYLANREWLKLP
jgi:dTDP-glucose 4,6-dehydratase